jgi:mevalonate kinase
MPTYRANGKLLLTGEYLVIHGALALALPTKLGQTLEVESSEDAGLHWSGLDDQSASWLEVQFDTLLNPTEISEGGEEAVERLAQLLRLAQQSNPEFLKSDFALRATTRLEFPRDWGLGSSSTLVHLISQWAEVDPYPLQEEVFGGSGYDIACAGAEGPILYKRVKQGDSISPVSRPAPFNPSFSDKLFFVHLGAKQNSRVAIASFEDRMKEVGGRPEAWLNTLVHQTIAIQNAATAHDFGSLLTKHEEVIGAVIGQTPVRLARFPEFKGAVKSLGAWGGDFVLAVSEEGEDYVRDFFSGHGLSTFVPWSEMIL